VITAIQLLGNRNKLTDSDVDVILSSNNSQQIAACVIVTMLYTATDTVTPCPLILTYVSSARTMVQIYGVTLGTSLTGNLNTPGCLEPGADLPGLSYSPLDLWPVSKSVAPQIRQKLTAHQKPGAVSSEQASTIDFICRELGA
jgi:hypothetical protein